MSRKLIELFNRFWTARSKDIIIGCIGRIESFDSRKMRADVQPLLEYTASGSSSGTKFAVIGDIPVQFLFSGGYYIRPHYSRGDLVWITYSTFSIENALNNGFDNTSGSHFSRESASVSHGIALENWTAPEAFSDGGLLIGHKSGGVKLQITETDIIGKGTKISWDGDFEILNAVEPAVLGNTLVTVMNTFCLAVAAITPGAVAENAAALSAIKAAATALLSQLESIKAQKVKVS
jgi:hypothetical protein